MNKKRFDMVLFIGVCILTLFGLVMIYSASSIWAAYKFNDAFKYVKQQGLFILIGLPLLIFISRIDYSFYYKKSNLLLGICLLLLVLVLIPGIGSVRNGSQSWFGIGSFGVQPSEAVKLALIIYSAKYLAINNKKLKHIIRGVGPLLAVLFLVFGLIMLQPDFGTGMIIIVSILAMMFVAGVDIKFFLSLGFVGVFGIIGLIVVAPYRMDRIVSFIDPWKDPLGTGFQIIQSLYSIGPGGLLGQGFLNSRQKQFYLPEPQTDFIFSIIAEEFGVVGAIIVTGLFTLVLYRGIKIALNTRDEFSKYLAFGMIFQIIIQAVMNLFVVIGLIPVTGVTLPFLSYGGSSLLITLVSIGILLNISRYNK